MKSLLYITVIVAYALTLYRLHKEKKEHEEKIVDNEFIYGVQLIAYLSCIYFLLGSNKSSLKHRLPLFILLSIATIVGVVFVVKSKNPTSGEALSMKELNQIDNTIYTDNSDRKFMDNDFRESLMADMEREINDTRSGVERVKAAVPSMDANDEIQDKKMSSVGTKELLYLSCFILVLDIFIFNKQFSMNRYHKGVLQPPSGFIMFIRKCIRLMGIVIPFIDSYFVYYYADQLS